jgi:16S rRNA (uracil1498-N3)-methyltransferase
MKWRLFFFKKIFRICLNITIIQIPQPAFFVLLQEHLSAVNFFYHPALTSTDDHIELDSVESHHAAKVLRSRIGELVTITNGCGIKAEAVFEEVNPKKSVLRIIKIHQEENPNLAHVAIANLKQRDRLEWFIEKAVEFGVKRITVFFSARTEKYGSDAKRLEKVAISALKQSGNPWLPPIETGVALDNLIKENGNMLIAHCSNQFPAALLKKTYKPKTNTTILIGPEGDFTEEEIKNAIDAGAIPVSLGPTRLRAETAALAALMTVHLANQD